MSLFAYVDPAAGGLLAQMLLGGTLGVVAFFRARMHRLRKRDVEEPVVEAEAADPVQ